MHLTSQVMKSPRRGRIWNSGHQPRSIENMQETELTPFLPKCKSSEHCIIQNRTVQEVCSAHEVAKASCNAEYTEDIRPEIIDLDETLNKSGVLSEPLLNMDLECMEQIQDITIGNSDDTEDDETAFENERIGCVCSCHSRRNFQQNEHSKNHIRKPGSYDRKYHSDQLLTNSQRNLIGEINSTESIKTQRSFRTRLKSVRFSEKSSVGISEERPQYLNFKCFRLRSNMAKIVCHCIMLFLVCLGGGVVMVHQSAAITDNSMIHNVKGFKLGKAIPAVESSIILDLPFRGVSKQAFANHLSQSQSAAEMLKIFFSDPNLTEDQVNSIMYMKTHQAVYGWNRATTQPMMNDENTNYREIAYSQYVEFERNPLSDCSEPKPEIERIEETYSDSVRHFLPSCTIVHRCRNTTACCPPGHICAPRAKNGIELIERFFMVLEAVPGSDDLRPAKEFIAAKTFINHTACECQRVEVKTNCHRSCPMQFTMKRPGVDCECICASGHRKCHKINKGLLPLDEKDLECIKEDKCIVPKCLAGQFSISTGFCPHFRRHGRKRSRKV